MRHAGNGDLTQQITRLPAIRNATLKCYGGNCSFCFHNALVCSGTGSVGDWWYHSVYLPTHNIHRLNMTEDDSKLMSTILEIRLSEQAVQSVRSNTSTQKCEGFNRGVLSTMPKHIKMSRNFEGSLASKTLQLNNTLQVSVEKKIMSLTGNKLSARAERYIKFTSKRSSSHKEKAKSSEAKTRRKRNRANMEHMYHVARSTGQYVEEYAKGQLDEAGPSGI